ncbi:hypothetical protein HPB51_018733 [Rhipicephalus microplus]|uniref:Uncharacterized protein n=1 Tax=Rhipicephalus microplus TaxID=6941 RepID=A0A9J6DI35_RHIMP|nr:hypothetical protein HPB51_018733 [Rhipicephalus microplus]
MMFGHTLGHDLNDLFSKVQLPKLPDFSAKTIDQVGQQVSDLRHSITKRGTQPSKHKFNTIKEVSFRAHGRDFRLILNPTKGLLSAHFKAYTVDGSGNKRPVWVDQNQFYEGRVFGELVSNLDFEEAARNHEQSNQLSSRQFISAPAVVYVQRARHYNRDVNVTSVDAVSAVFKNGIDVLRELIRSVVREELQKLNGNPSTVSSLGEVVREEVRQAVREQQPQAQPVQATKYCGYVKENGNATEVTGDLSENLSHWNDGSSITSHVQKRQAMEPYHWEPVQTRCSLLLVADHRFYENMGGRNLKSTINFLITLIDRVNKIFLDTEWRDSDRHPGFRGMGFVIQEVMVHTEPTPVLRNEVHYNMAGVTWNVRDLLEASFILNHRWFCLAHLFTDQKFEGGILGLAYVGSPRRNSVGGICSPGYVKNGYTLYLNSGLSTSRNHYGQRVITREADLVTAHGHNWGSEHDPDLPECSPDSQRGGSYLMYTYSVSGYDPNNKKFSPCSVRSIRAVLLAKASKCFSKPEESFCGNSLVEEGEQCDAGLIGSEDSDPCCDEECRLKPNAKCRGKCRAGECMPYCETRGEVSCMCDTEVDACKRCCRPSHNATCKPTEPMEILRDGTPCIHGYCEKGKCEKTVQDIVERFWDIIEDIDINTVLKFLNDNIVGTVIVVSMIVWVPGSCLISYVFHAKWSFFALAPLIPLSTFQSLQPFRPPSDSSVKVVHISRRQPPPQPEPQPQPQPQPRTQLPLQTPSDEQVLAPTLRLPSRAPASSDYWQSPSSYASSERGGVHPSRYEGRLYARPSSVAEGANYSRHEPSDYYHHLPLHTQGYGRQGATSVSSDRPGSRSRQHIENYTAL